MICILKQTINLIGLLILLFASLTSCKSNTGLKESSVLTFITGDCFGSCQVYRVTIFSMGKVTFTGKKNVKKMDDSTYNIPKDMAKGIYDQFHSLDLNTKIFNPNLRDFPEKKLINKRLIFTFKLSNHDKKHFLSINCMFIIHFI